jgi:hypothetical protein
MTLWVLVVIGIGYSSLLYYRGTVTGVNHADGILGVVLGLYVCSHPAANLVDLLFYRRGIRYQVLSSESVVLWLALNMLVLFVAGIVIFCGTTQLIGRTD